MRRAVICGAYGRTLEARWRILLLLLLLLFWEELI